VLDRNEVGNVLMDEFLQFNFKDIDELDEVEEYLQPGKIGKLSTCWTTTIVDQSRRNNLLTA